MASVAVRNASAGNPAICSRVTSAPTPSSGTGSIVVSAICATMTAVHTPPNCNPPPPLEAARSLAPAPPDVTLVAGTTPAIDAANSVSPTAYRIVVGESDVSIQNGNGPVCPSNSVQARASTKCATVRPTTAPTAQSTSASAK